MHVAIESHLKVDNPRASFAFVVEGIEAAGDFIGELLRGEISVQLLRHL
jgi:hypothetical protein